MARRKLYGAALEAWTKARRVVRRKTRRVKRKVVTTMARRRSYSRKRKNYGRRKGGFSISLTDLGYLAAVGVEMGIPQAIRDAQSVGIMTALENMGRSVTLNKVVQIGLTTGMYGLVKKIMPSKKLIGIGPVSIRS